MIHLIGPGGAGKTTVGFALATRLGIVFMDLDGQFAGRAGDISKYLSTHGYEAYARQNVQIVGALLALVAGLFATAVGLDRDRGFYPTVMIVIASLYALFAVIGAFTQALVLDSVVGSLSWQWRSRASFHRSGLRRHPPCFAS